MRCLAVAAFLSGYALFGDSIVTNGSFEDTTNIVPSWSTQDTNGLTDYFFDFDCSPGVLCFGNYPAAGSPVLSGWTVTGGVDMGEAGYDGYWSAADGIFALDLNGLSPDGNSSVSQVLTGLTPGAKYDLTFALSENTAYCHGDNRCRLQVTVDGVTWNYYLAGMYEQAMMFTSETIVFTAADTDTTLSFENETGISGLPGGPVIDDVQVNQEPAPEPSSALLMMLGAGLVILRKAPGIRQARCGPGSR